MVPDDLWSERDKSAENLLELTVEDDRWYQPPQDRSDKRETPCERGVYIKELF